MFTLINNLRHANGSLPFLHGTYICPGKKTIHDLQISGRKPHFLHYWKKNIIDLYLHSNSFFFIWWSFTSSI